MVRITLIIIPIIIVILYTMLSFFFDVVTSAAGCADYQFNCDCEKVGYCAYVEFVYFLSVGLLLCGLVIVELILVRRADRIVKKMKT